MKTAIFALALTLGLVAGAFAIENGITPYGDFCPLCSKYGACKKTLTDKESVDAMKAYFKERGLSPGKITGRGRFIKVDVMENGHVVDVVIFDRKTGRLRSIY